MWKLRDRTGLRPGVKVARKDRAKFACAPRAQKAKELPRKAFGRTLERHQPGKETEAWEIIYFKIYKSQPSVVEKTLETAALMLELINPRGYCSEMICADFLAGATLENSESQFPLPAVSGGSSEQPCPGKPNRRRPGQSMNKLSQRMARLRLSVREYATLRTQVLERDGWCCQSCGSSKNLHVHDLKSQSKLWDDALENLISLCAHCHARQHNYGNWDAEEDISTLQL